jgi:hypothetical protein
VAVVAVVVEQDKTHTITQGQETQVAVEDLEEVQVAVLEVLEEI